MSRSVRRVYHHQNRAQVAVFLQEYRRYLEAVRDTWEVYCTAKSDAESLGVMSQRLILLRQELIRVNYTLLRKLGYNARLWNHLKHEICPPAPRMRCFVQNYGEAPVEQTEPERV